MFGVYFIYIMCEFAGYIFLSCKIFEGELCLIEICLPKIKSFQIVFCFLNKKCIRDVCAGGFTNDIIL